MNESLYEDVFNKCAFKYLPSFKYVIEELQWTQLLKHHCSIRLITSPTFSDSSLVDDFDDYSSSGGDFVNEPQH